MSTTKTQDLLEELANSIEIPDEAYKTAKERYKDLGRWLEDKAKSKSAGYGPHVFAQGSFRLGTAIKPQTDDNYDLDLACKLREGLNKSNISQEKLKILIGEDLDAYRKARGVKDPLEPKHRCWRLNYQDQLGFHMDTVPCIPAGEDRQQMIKTAMLREGAGEALAQNVAELSVSITDDRRLPEYKQISDDWLISNPEGYALWFEHQMRKAEIFLESRAGMMKVAKVENLPTWQWKTPLQKCVQLLKHHRDNTHKNDPDGKPISVIITTLAARAYEGESDLRKALGNILSKMGNLVNDRAPRVPNPVNPHKEDFADKWATEEGRKLELEEKFWNWLKDAQETYRDLTQSTQTVLLEKQAFEKFGVKLNESVVTAQVRRNGLLAKAATIAVGASTNPDGVVGNAGVSNKPHKFYG